MKPGEGGGVVDVGGGGWIRFRVAGDLTTEMLCGRM